jgi:hypothetical protein
MSSILKPFFIEGFVLFLKNKAKSLINVTYLVYLLSTFIIFLAFLEIVFPLTVYLCVCASVGIVYPSICTYMLVLQCVHCT